jgi:hypothetical protein
MPAGDAQRTWFPDMIEMLRAEWTSSMSVPDLIDLCAHLDDTLQHIRTSRNILPPMMWCPHCRKRRRAAPPKVSVRATILALGRFQIASAEQTKALEKAWKKYRKTHHLDLYGHSIPEQPETCLHGEQ